MKAGWREFFKKNTPDPEQVARLVVQLHDAKRDADVVAVLEAAILNGQSQSWMYEVLALAMQVTGRPQADIERVLLSAVDFSAVDVPNMLLSAAYLSKFGLNSRALSLYRQATQLSPSHPEAYLLGLKLAREAKDVDAIEWAAAGILTQAWGKDHEELHRLADEAVAEGQQLLKNPASKERLVQFQTAIANARQRDLVLKLTWNGNADLDLMVEEPFGTICSRQTKFSRGGGVLVHDGFGPKAQNAYELYVCPVAAPGKYKVTIHHVVGDVVAKQAKLTIIRHQGTQEETTFEQVVTLVGVDTILTLGLKSGRRTDLEADVPVAIRPRVVEPDRFKVASEIRQAGYTAEDRARQIKVARQAEVRRREVLFQNIGGFQAGFQPVVQNFTEGVKMSAMAVVSPDRRYVRLSLAPAFTSITDIFTFTFAGSGNVNQAGGKN
ncbi:MAG: hypothetical protein JWM11_6813 [Planctomycetaceae bacterium]|nr:hypothetical protein [Planctomycetaceae bacterium]